MNLFPSDFASKVPSEQDVPATLRVAAYPAVWRVRLATPLLWLAALICGVDRVEINMDASLADDMVSAEGVLIPGEVDELPPAEGVGIALRYALDELRKYKPNDRSEADRAYAIAITDLQKIVAFFEMAVIQGDDGGLESMYDRLDAVLGEPDDDAR